MSIYRVEVYQYDQTEVRAYLRMGQTGSFCKVTLSTRNGQQYDSRVLRLSRDDNDAWVITYEEDDNRYYGPQPPAMFREPIERSAIRLVEQVEAEHGTALIGTSKDVRNNRKRAVLTDSIIHEIAEVEKHQRQLQAAVGRLNDKRAKLRAAGGPLGPRADVVAEQGDMPVAQNAADHEPAEAAPALVGLPGFGLE